MNLQMMQPNSNVMKMTSLEIADLVNKRHDNVKRTIETIANTGSIVQPQIESVPGQDAMGRPRATQVYVFSGEQGRRDSIVVVAQLSPEFTAALVDRWAELETMQQVAPVPAIPQSLSQALRLAADQAEQIEQQQAHIAAIEPKAAALDVLEASFGSLNVRDTAKLLDIKQNKFTEWCVKHGWMYRDSQKRLQPNSIRITSGLMQLRPVTYEGKEGVKVATTQAIFTPKGLARLARIFAIVKEVA
ncbi:phage antirepressor KilAC domain-containing protein [Psychrobacter arenosus]|uniref:phage antirepressor KilAC domain-containing protein n=1 Tax=Psychrobacter arenosus TaxID=256326 RepID=UPI001D1075DB|nr:phage antirepressor KilAC domain-containing protein [Psychrobacter arenosus]